MNKLCSLSQAISRNIEDGMSVATGCGLESLIPFAAGYEIIRQKKRDLTLIAPISDIQLDQIIGAGCARKIVAAWVGNVAAGLAHNFRRAMEDGIPRPLEVEEHSNFTIGLALQAAAMGLPFLPTKTARGSDFSRADHFQPLRCPFTKEELLAVRAVKPDVAILHVQRADVEGNAHLWGNLGVTVEAARAARKVVLTCEEIVDHEVILSDPNRTLIQGFLVSSVVHVPFGSHPSPTQGFARRDDDFYFDYHKESRNREGFERWLERWVLGVKDHQEFLKRLGEERVRRLKPEGNLFSPSVSFNL
ncbi:MAG: CoA transferase subunit A [Deltaproteobacteria bacterium]|nr:CoA transferase subunit A [Deltaproteobacteria bacterium]MBI2538647.1 CoA transferase subunit A [Deltaproteobacteria bacterium]